MKYRRKHPASPGRWRRLTVIALQMLLLALSILVLLVLTGIIAEPETVIESIIRMLFGG